MNTGDLVYHKEKGLLKVTKKNYRRMGNRMVFFGEDENGVEHELDGTEESPEKFLKERAKEEEKALKEAEKISKEQEKDAEKQKKEQEKQSQSEQAINIVLGKIQSLKGDKGDAGYTPEKGKDYWTEEEKKELIDEIWKKVVIPMPKDGLTPEAGIDYPSYQEVQTWVEDAVATIPRPKEVDLVKVADAVLKMVVIPAPIPGKPGKDGSPDTPQVIKEKIESLKGDERIDASAIKNLPKPELIRMGGGDSYTGLAKVETTDTPGTLEEKIIAGTNVTITKTNGTLRISSSGSGSGHTIQDEGTPLTSRSNLNFVGAGVAVTDDAGNDATVVTISSGGSGGHTIKEAGSSLTQRTGLNFGSGFDLSDDSINDETDVALDLSEVATGGDLSWSGNTPTVANGAITLAKQADMATASVVYRKTAGTGAPEVQTLATLKTDLGLTGTNSGDQTSIVGITGTKSQFNTALTDGDFLFSGDVTQYTDELAQDAVGGILTDSSEIDFTYNDATPSITASIVAGSIDEAKLDASVNASLDLADSALQSSAIGSTVQGYDADLTTLSTAFTTASASGAASLKFHEDTDNGTNAVTLQGPASTADVTITLPATAGTVALISDVDDLSGVTDAATARTNLGLGTIATEAETNYALLAGRSGGQTLTGGTGTTDDLTLKTTSGVGATGADMHFLVGNNGATEAMTILNSGNVGIGTASPSKKLQVNGGVQIGDATVNSIDFRLTRTTSGLNADANYFVATANTPVHNWIEGGYLTGERAGTITAPNSGYPYYEEWSGNGASTIKTLGFINKTSGSFTISDMLPVLTMARTGKVGIGTTSPTAVLHLKAGTATASTAPLKMTAGTVNTTPEAGAIEFDGTDLFISI